MTQFEELMTRPDVGVRFWLEVQGIGTLFLDGALPTGPTGAAWDSTPTLPDDGAASPLAYVVMANALDPRGGLVDQGAEISRSTGDVSPSTMRLHLRDDDADTLLALFARHKSGGLRTNLSGSVPYGDGGSGPGTADLPVESVSGWTVGDLVYFGRETLEVAAVGGSTLVCNRNQYALADCDSRYLYDANRGSAPRVIANYPRVWVGRYVRLWAFAVNAGGVAYDADWRGTFCQEVWRGVLSADPRPIADWSTWELQADSIESILRTEVGLESRRATLVQSLGGLTQRLSGAPVPPASAPDAQSVYWVDEHCNRIAVQVLIWTDQATKDAGAAPAVTEFVGATALSVMGTVPNLVRRTQLRAAIADALSTALLDPTSWSTVWSSITVAWKSGRWQIVVYNPTVFVFEVRLLWNEPDSIGPLLGWSAPETFVVGSYGMVQSPAGAGYAVYLPDRALRVPFFYESEVPSLKTAPSSGYAIMGEGDAMEIVRYSSITTLGSTLRGLYVLEVTSRGQFGTRPRDFSVTLADHEAGTDAIRVAFGVGWEARGFPSILLELATSTGAAAHGDYDVLPDGVGARLARAHFDVAGLEALEDALPAFERDRSMMLQKTTKLSELMAAWLQPIGRFVRGRSRDGLYRISVGQALPPIESEARVEITVREVSVDAPLRYSSGGRIINQVRAHYRWNAAKGENTDGDTVDVIDDDSVAEYGVRNKLEWKLIGWSTDGATAVAATLLWATDVFRRHGRPYDVLTFETDRSCWALSEGDTIGLTIPGWPTTRGTRGARMLAVVLQVEKRYSGEDLGGQVRVAVESPERYSQYSPCARVDAWDSADGITLSDNAYTEAGVDTDWAHFRAGDVVYVYADDCDATTRSLRTIVSIDDADVVLDSALPGTFAAGPRTLVMFANYADQVARQRAFAAIADNAATLSDDPTEGFRYA